MTESNITYLNPDRSAAERADDLLQRMSIEEKMGQIVGFFPLVHTMEQLVQDNPQGVGQVSLLFAGMLPDMNAVAERITQIQTKIMELSEHRIPALFHIETLTGALIPGATSFPSGIGTGSTWNPGLHKEMSTIASKQARSVGASHAFAPVLDISRDPRFGRQGETYGEDPALASAMAAASVSGLQNDGQLKDGMIACAKHFLGYQAAQGGMHAASTSIPPRMLREIYAKPFQAAITSADMKSIMNTYSSIDGDVVAGSKHILTDLLRGEMGFGGLTVSDYTSIAEQYTRQKVSASKTDAGERSLKAGMDIELPFKECYNDELMMRIKNGMVDIEVLDRAVRNVLIAKFELGLFENPFAKSKEEIERIYTDQNNERIGLEAARQSLILLKNNGVLPAKRVKQKIAVIGHHASSTRSLFGGYSFATLAENMLGNGNTMAGVDFEKISNLSADEFSGNRDHYTYPGSQVKVELSAVEDQMKKYFPNAANLLEQIMIACPEAEVTYAYGYAYAGNDTSKHAEALAIAADADLVIVTLGGKNGWGMTSTTGEGVDSTNINLPACQESFIEKLAGLNKATVAIHFDGRPISSDMADRHIDAIIEAWNPGQYGAVAITDVLFGDYNPAGRLPVTVAYHAGQLPIFYNHDHGASYSVGTTSDLKSYVDCPRKPRYYFGHGLSYTSFAYSELRISQATYDPNEKLIVQVDVTNTGEQFGEEVVQLYIRDCYASMVRPVQELAGFLRVPLAPQEKKTIEFTMSLSQFAFLDADMRWKVEAGDMELMVGASSVDIRATGAFVIQADSYIDGKSRAFHSDVKVMS